MYVEMKMKTLNQFMALGFIGVIGVTLLSFLVPSQVVLLMLLAAGVSAVGYLGSE